MKVTESKSIGIVAMTLDVNIAEIITLATLVARLKSLKENVENLYTEKYATLHEVVELKEAIAFISKLVPDLEINLEEANKSLFEEQPSKKSISVDDEFLK